MKPSFVLSIFALAIPAMGAAVPARRCRAPAATTSTVVPSPSSSLAPAPVRGASSPAPSPPTTTSRTTATSSPSSTRTSQISQNTNNAATNTNNNSGGSNNNGGNGGGNNSANGSLASLLFPPGLSYSNGFTTANGVSIPGVTRVALSDGALNVHGQSGLGHPVVQRSGKTAWEASYPRGSYKPSARPLGGFGFYVAGNDAFRNAVNAGAKEVVLSYSLMFQEGFEFNMGGKLPGGFGGIGRAAEGCSGGRQADRASCFSLRMMWRNNGQSELYTYLPDSSANTAAQLRVPSSHRNPDFGFSVGRGLTTFPRGQWVTVSERIRLNDIGASNGEVQVRLNGRTVIDVKGLSLRTSGQSKVQGLHFQTFFGGGSPIWASAKDQKAWFADVSGAIVN